MPNENWLNIPHPIFDLGHVDEVVFTATDSRRPATPFERLVADTIREGVERESRVLRRIAYAFSDPLPLRETTERP